MAFVVAAYAKESFPFAENEKRSLGVTSLPRRWIESLADAEVASPDIAV